MDRVHSRGAAGSDRSHREQEGPGTGSESRAQGGGTTSTGHLSPRSDPQQQEQQQQQAQQRHQEYPHQPCASTTMTTTFPHQQWLPEPSLYKDNNDSSSWSYPSSSALSSGVDSGRTLRPAAASGQSWQNIQARVGSSPSSWTAPWTTMATAVTGGSTPWMASRNNNINSKMTQANSGTQPPSTNSSTATNTTHAMSPMLQHLTAISQHIALQGLVQGTGSDISLRAFNKTYRLHRLFLTQATFFEHMLQGPWRENEKDLVEMSFDDPNITQEGFDIALGQLYGIWAVESEDDQGGREDRIGATAGAGIHMDEQMDMKATQQALGDNNRQMMVPPSILTPRNVLSVLAVAAYLGMDSLCEQCTSFATSTLRTDHILSYIEFTYQSDYYPWSNKIAQACHAYMCRNGFEDPKMVCLHVFERLPVDWLIRIVGSDAFWVPGEWDRYEFCRQVVHRRRAISACVRSISARTRAAAAISSSGIEPLQDIVREEQEQDEDEEEDEEEAYAALFSSCIIYMHMSLEQLQCIQRDVDPVTGTRFVRSSVIQEALWHQVEFRNLIETHASKDPSPSNNGRVGSHAYNTGESNSNPALNIVMSGCPEDDDVHGSGGRLGWIRRPFSMYKPIPERDITLMGDEDEPPLDDISSSHSSRHVPSLLTPTASKSASASVGLSATRATTSTNPALVPSTAPSSNSTPSFWSTPLPGRQQQSQSQRHQRQRQLSPPNPALMQLSKKQRTMDSVSNDAAGGCHRLGLGPGFGKHVGAGTLGGGVGAAAEVEGPLKQYSVYAPFRFSVSFMDVQTLRENVRVCSDAFFYAGSYWNLYIQKLPTNQNGGLQLGVYLHRHSLPNVSSESGVRRRLGLPLFPLVSPSSHLRGSGNDRRLDVESLLQSEVEQQGDVDGVCINGDIRNIDLPPLVPLEGQLHRLRQQALPESLSAGTIVSHWSSSTGSTGAGGAGGVDMNIGGASTTVTPSPTTAATGAAASGTADATPPSPSPRPVEATNTVTAAAAASFENSFSGFVDRREKTRTWFKIYAVSVGPGHDITQFQSAPDDFAVMQSWGWRSASLCGEGYLPESPIPKDDLSINFHTACHCTGLLVTPSSPFDATNSVPGVIASPTVLSQRADDAPSQHPTSMGTTRTTTTTMTDTTMEVDCVHEYEYEEEEEGSLRTSSCGGSSTPSSGVAGLGGDGHEHGASTPVRSRTEGDHQQHLPTTRTCQHLDPLQQSGSGGGSEGIKFFIRSPYFDNYALDEDGQIEESALEDGKEARLARCDCEAQSRCGTQHHHHPVQPVALQFSIVMGHV
ncbi:MAG: hypothetical protein J3R72DRAFT_523521 [Linnemannia gamsii]|nr:MAG: hypothetical protein J3R72DRAFT_523521 [Linnemannia gamsii]